MSIKTLRKRIALVAVAALAVTGLSTVAANAGAGTATAIAVSYTTEVDGVDLAVGKYVSNPIRDAQQISSMTVPAGSSVELEVTAVGGTFTTDDDIKVELAGYGLVVATEALAATASGAESVLTAFTAPSVAGTYTLNLTLAKNGTFAAGTDLTNSITMVVTKASFSAGRSTSYLDEQTDGTCDETGAEEVRVSSAIGTKAAQIYGQLKDSDGNAYNNLKIRAEISGVGLVKAISGACAAAANGDARSSDATLTGTNAYYIDISADGQSGSGTVTVSVINPSTGATIGVIGTHTVNFYSTTVATLTATALSTVARPGVALGCSSATTCDQATYADTPFITVVAKDSKGNLIKGLALDFNTADSSIIAASTSNAVTSEAAGDDAATTCVSTDCNGLGYVNASITAAVGAKSGSSTKVYYSYTLANGTVIKSNELTISVGGAIASTALALDKATYAPGEGMVMTITAKDSAGNAPYDGQGVIYATTSMTSSKGVGGSLPSDAAYFVGGKYTKKTNLYAPVLGGSFVISGTGNDAAATAFSGSATVASPNDAAIASLVAAIAKLQKAINKINKRLKK